MTTQHVTYTHADASGARQTEPRGQYFRRQSLIDRVLTEAGRALQVLDGSMPASRPNPAGKMPPADSPDAPPALTPDEQRHAAGLMRVNHESEEHTSELQSRENLVCRLLL